MMRPNGWRRGFSLIEAVIGAVITGLLLAILLLMFSGSVRSTTHGMIHLTQAQAASFLIRHLESDVQRATRFSIGEDSLTLESVRDFAGGMPVGEKVIWWRTPGGTGLNRQREGEEPIVHARGLLVEAMPGAAMFSVATFPGSLRPAVMVRLRLADAQRAEAIAVSRLLIADNAAVHQTIRGWQP